MPSQTTAVNDGNRANPLVTFVLAGYVFLLVSRTTEFSSIFLGVNTYLIMAFSVVGVACVVLGGNALRIFTQGPGRYFFALTCWILMAGLTSTWHRRSFEVVKDEWARSVLAFLIVAGLTTTFRQFRTVAYLIGIATAVAGILTSVLGGSFAGRFSLQVGTFANANGLAFHLLVGLPFCLYIFLESKMAGKIAMALVMTVILTINLRTGSRGGLIITCVLMLMLLFHVSMANKVKLIFAGGIAAVIALAFVPGQAMERYRTLFDGDGSDNTSAFRSAVESREARIIHLKESIEFTFKNPLFGVGPGVFQSASSAQDTEEGRKAMWRETHNAYTQISSECGIPGLLAFLAVLGSSWRAAFRVGKAAVLKQNASISNFAFCLKMSLAALTINGCFDSMGYQYYIALLAAIAASLETSTVAALAQKIVPRPITMPVAVPALAVAGAPGAPSGIRATSSRLRFGGYRRLRQAQ